MNQTFLPTILQQEFHGVLFDLDGTLLDSEELHFAAFDEAMKEFGYDFKKMSEKISYKGSFRKMFEEIAQNEHFDEEKYQMIYARKMEITIATHEAHTIDFVDGALAFLEYLTEMNVPFGVVTNSDRPYAEHALSSHDLTGYMKTLITSTDLQRFKPAPDGYLQGARDLGLEPEQVLVFENTDTGIQAGKDAGMAVITIYGTDAKGYSNYEKADLVIDNFGDANLNDIKFFSTDV